MTPDVDITLPNGVRLVVAAVDGPRVVVEHRLSVGAAHEDPAARGAAHLVEHLLFPAGLRGGADPFTTLLRDAGGEANAFTAVDRTVYTTEIPADRLDALLALEARRFAPHVFTDADVAREIAVTAEEHAWRFDTAEDETPDVARVVLGGHPYGELPSPSVEAVLSLDRADAQAFFDRWYRAERLTVVIAGPVDPAVVRSRVTTLYGGLPGGAPPDPFPHLTAWSAPSAVSGRVAPSLVWAVPGPGDPDHDAFVLLDAAGVVSVVDYVGGSLAVWRAPTAVDPEEAEGAVRRLGCAALEDEGMARAVDWLATTAPTWSPGAWVAAWGRRPGDVTLAACEAAWNRWVRDMAPIVVGRGR